MGAYEYIRLIKRENYNRFLDDANAFNKNPWAVKKPDIDDYLEKEEKPYGSLYKEVYLGKDTVYTCNVKIKPCYVIPCCEFEDPYCIYDGKDILKYIKKRIEEEYKEDWNMIMHDFKVSISNINNFDFKTLESLVNDLIPKYGELGCITYRTLAFIKDVCNNLDNWLEQIDKHEYLFVTTRA